jgi:hypothetical protein
MKTKVIFIFLAIISTSVTISAQNSDNKTSISEYKNQIGIQLNPLFDNNETFSPIIYGLRYGYRIYKPLTLGAELSGSFPAFNDPYVRYSDLRIGAFARYTFLPEKRIQGFLEASPFFAHTYFRGTEFYPGDVILNQFGLYVAPGLSLFTKSRKLSMDLYYKFYVHPGDMYSRHNTISYKLNFHF